MAAGCERPFVEPFVAFINAAEQSDYAYDRCLDHVDRNHPQPEILYLDSRGHELVVERKSVVWPRDYVLKHKNQHVLMELLHAALASETDAFPCELWLDCDIKRPRAQLLTIGRQIASDIRTKMQGMDADVVLSGSVQDVRWKFRWESESERDWFEPQTGLVIRSDGEWIDSETPIPSGFSAELGRLVSAAMRKFRAYDSSRRILLLEPQGDFPTEWLIDTIRHAPILSNTEAWVSEHVMAGELEREWFFWQVYPRSGV